jgi:hypothetical protein
MQNFAVVVPVIAAIWKMEIDRTEFKASQAKSYQDPISKNKLGIVVHVCNPSYSRGIGRRITVQVDPGKDVRFCLKNNKAKKIWGNGSNGRAPA